MTQAILLTSLLSSAIAWSQESPPTAQEVLDATLADLRGRTEIIERSVPQFSISGGPGLERPGTVSAKRLRHRPPKAARKAYEKAARSKDLRIVAKELERAVALDPDLAEAHNDLGVVYTQLGRYPEAAAEFRRAIELVPEEPLPHSNLTWVLSAMGGRLRVQ